MSTIRTVCVYCGSGPGTDPAFIEAARDFGKAMGREGVGLVYGGGSKGLMGAVANSVLDNGGHVTGIIPEFLQNREQTLRRAQEVIITPDMHVRKQTMFDRADAFVALPGGIGTLEELVEQLTWAQLGRHKKPILILNIKSFWDPLCALLDHMRRLDFIRLELGVTLARREQPRRGAAEAARGGRAGQRAGEAGQAGDGRADVRSAREQPVIALRRLRAVQHRINQFARNALRDRQAVVQTIPVVSNRWS